MLVLLISWNLWMCLAIKLLPLRMAIANLEQAIDQNWLPSLVD
jgi:hypothetical protein